MQTLRLPAVGLRDLRAISLRHSLSRWRTPSMRAASTWKGASPLPNLPRPTWPVGSRCAARGRRSVTDRARLRPGPSRWRIDRGPAVGAGLPPAFPVREASVCGAGTPDGRRVCRRQTARDLTHDPAPHAAGDHGSVHGQARTSATQWAASFELSFPLRSRPCRQAPRSEARASGEKTADPMATIAALAGVSSGAPRRHLASAEG